jgi:ankyrin repeat protein
MLKRDIALRRASHNVPLAHLSIENGSKVQYGDEYEVTFSPLHAARSAEIVLLLLDHNADSNMPDEDDHGLLLWYAIRNNIAALRTILQYGTEVDGVAILSLHRAASKPCNS